MRGIQSSGQLAAWLAERPGVRVVGERQPAPAPAAPPGEVLRPMRTLLAHLRGLAQRHGWVALEMFNKDGDDAGLHVILFRDGVTVVATMPLGPLSPGQQGWLRKLRATGAAEVYVWSAQDVEAIAACLGRPRREGTR